MKHHKPIEWRIEKKFDVDRAEILGWSEVHGGRLVLLEKNENINIMVINHHHGDFKIDNQYGYLKEVDYEQFDLKEK
jgi:hypothetical protein